LTQVRTTSTVQSLQARHYKWLLPSLARHIVVQTEGRARLRMAAYAATLGEPDMRDALTLDAWEGSSHILLFANWVAWPLAHDGCRSPCVLRRGSCVRKK